MYHSNLNFDEFNVCYYLAVTLYAHHVDTSRNRGIDYREAGMATGCGDVDEPLSGC